MAALISDCGTYRYWLNRTLQDSAAEKGSALFIMLNPSTADAHLDDNTIRRCKGFAAAWGCTGVTVGNLYAFRSTDPKGLWRHADPIGPDNDRWLADLAAEHGDIVCAWGANARQDRVMDACTIMQKAGARLWCLGVTRGGHPRHPLYVPASATLVPWAAGAG